MLLNTSEKKKPILDALALFYIANDRIKFSDSGLTIAQKEEFMSIQRALSNDDFIERLDTDVIEEYVERIEHFARIVNQHSEDKSILNLLSYWC